MHLVRKVTSVHGVESQLRAVPIRRRKAVDRVESFGAGPVDEAFDDVCADALPSPSLGHADTRYLAERLVALVDANPAESGLLVGFFVERDDVVAGPKRAIVEPQFLERVEQPDLVSVLGIPDVHSAV